jgi:uncharacterized protein YukE
MSGSSHAQLSVSPTQLRAAVTQVAAASEALASARAALEAAEQAAAPALAIEGRAAHKMHTFVRQYRSELDLVSESLVGYRDVLERSAECYEQVEDALVDAMGGG